LDSSVIYNRESEIVGAVSGSTKPIQKGSLCKTLSYAISSRSSYLTGSVGRREEQDSATLVERHSRFLMLIKVPGKETEAAVAALRAMSKNPRRSLQ